VSFLVLRSTSKSNLEMNVPSKKLIEKFPFPHFFHTHACSKREMLTLPKDILGLIFSKLYKIEAKGVPLTCKLFSLILSSKRYFPQSFKTFSVTIQELPLCLHFSLLEAAKKVLHHHHHQLQHAHTPASITVAFLERLPRSVTVKYDHYDTLESLLQRFRHENQTTWPNCETTCYSLYAHDQNNNLFAFRNENNFVTAELDYLYPPNQHTLYTSDFTWQELRESIVTWSDIMSEALFGHHKKEI
jgi:hypothetical protein